jgi:chromosome segregation ATPase
MAAERNVSKVNKDMEELQSEMDRIVRRLDACQASNNELRKLLDSEKEMSKKYATDASTEHARGDAVTVDLAKAHVALQDLHRQVDFMKTQLNSTKEAGTSVESMLNAEIDRLNEDLTKQNMQNRDLQANNERMNQEIVSLQSTNTQLAASNTKLAEQLSNEKAKIGSLERDLEMSKNAIAKAKEQVAKIQNEMKENSKEKMDMRAALDAAVAERDAAIQARDSIRALVNKLKAQIELLLQDLNEQKGTNDILCDEIASLQGQLAEANERIRAAEEDAKKAWGKVVMLEDRIAAMQMELDSLNSTKEALASLEAAVSNGLQGVADMVKAFNDQKAKMLKQIDQLEQEVRSIHQNEMDAYNEIIDLRRELDQYTSDVEKERRKLEMALQRESEQANTILALRTENEKLSRQLEKHKQLLAEETARADSLKQQAEDAQAEHEKLAKEHARALEAARKMHDAVCRDNPCSNEGGVGVQIAEHESGEISLMTLYPGPARNCGKMASGDIILSVDAKDVKGMSADDVRRLVMGPAGTPVTIAAVRPGGQKYIVTLIRTGAGSPEAEDFIAVIEKETCDEAEAMHDELDRLRRQLAAMQPRMEALEAENERLKGIEKELQEALVKLRELEALKEKVKALEAENADLRDQLAKALARIKELEKELDAEKRNSAALKDQLARKEAELQAEKDKREALQKLLDDARAEIERLRKEMAEALERLRKEHAEELDRLRKEHAAEIKALMAENQKLRKELDDLMAKIRALEQQLAAEKARNAELERQIKDLLARLKELEEQNAQLEKDLLLARTAAERAEARAEDLAARLAEALADVQRLCNAISKLETQIAGGLGLSIVRTEDPSKPANSSPVVVKGILEGGPAGQSGQFSVGDTIMAVDNKPLKGLRIDEVRHVGDEQ